MTTPTTTADTTTANTESTRPAGKSAALELLHQGVSDLMSSEGWRKALAFRRRFHQYSFLNSTMILAQKPEATLVAGYRAWQQNERQVRKGEKGIAILAPMLVKDRDDPDRKVLVGFRSVKVFDVSQTDGEPIPNPVRPQVLQDTPEDTAKLLGFDLALANYCASCGVTVRRDYQHAEALGYYNAHEKMIGVRQGLPAVQAFKTLVHESAHMLLHDRTKEQIDRARAELEAETTAFLVCHELGVDTSTYSFAYLAHWSGDLEALMQAGERASKAAATLVDAIGEHQAQLICSIPEVAAEPAAPVGRDRAHTRQVFAQPGQPQPQPQQQSRQELARR